MNHDLLPPGFKDEIFEEATLEHKYKNKIINLFQVNGYDLVKPPLIEYANFKKKNNFFLIKENKENKSFVLRNDMTMQVGRLATARLKNKKRPLKLCYYGEVVRKKGTMLRPERQFLQVGAECIGEDSFLADVEMLDLAFQALSLVGINNISIELSSSDFINFLSNKMGSNSNKEKILSFIRKKDLKNCFKYLDSSLHSFAKDILDCTGNLNEKKDLLKKLSINEKLKKTVNNLLNIYYKFQYLYPKVNVILDLSESDYFDYYTGTRFTIFAKNVRGEIARGGRYLLTNKTIAEHSTGFTCFMDTIIRASSIKEKINKILIPYDTSISRKKELIDMGYIIETFFGESEYVKKFAAQKNIYKYLENNKIIHLKEK